MNTAVPASTVPASVYAQRRARVAAELAKEGAAVAIVPTAPERARNRDSDFPYRWHDSYFYYLSGLPSSPKRPWC